MASVSERKGPSVTRRDRQGSRPEHRASAELVPDGELVEERKEPEEQIRGGITAGKDGILSASRKRSARLGPAGGCSVGKYPGACQGRVSAKAGPPWAPVTCERGDGNGF